MDQSELLQIIRQAADEGRTKLNLHGREIKELPPEIGKLTSLQSLYLDKNDLTGLPLEIKKLSSLTELGLRENPLPIPLEILEDIENTRKILDYYFQRIVGTTR